MCMAYIIAAFALVWGCIEKLHRYSDELKKEKMDRERVEKWKEKVYNQFNCTEMTFEERKTQFEEIILLLRDNRQTVFKALLDITNEYFDYCKETGLI